ncbi:unnamed protein product [Brachionus calyciflorus]|uniref:Uncharacterized protein n=1 Tax=Brachionus calyciflorus TaxID=104777 RepID=A0A814BX10_9BILA|nr:unnamed protein product [Brachionus calyciflorus]
MNDDNISQCSSTRRLEWDLFKEFTIETELDEALLTKNPYNIIRSSHSKTNCNLKNVCKLDRHKIHQEKRICKGHTYMDENEEANLSCPVQYKVFRCNRCSCYQLLQNNQQSVDCDDIINDNDLIHPESHVFGIHPKVKLILNDLIEKNLVYLMPTQAHIYLNLTDVSNGEMKGLPMPDRNQVKYYLRAYRNSNNVFSNKVEDVKNLVKGHLFSYELNDETPFFFGFDFDEFKDPILGNGESLSNAFRIGISSKKLINRVPSLLIINLVFHFT